MKRSTERWTCPDCQRVFGKKNQSHLKCEPAISPDQYFAQARPFERPIFDAVYLRLGHLDGLIVDPIGVGILLKNGPMFAELRPKTKWTALGFSLGRKVNSGRLSRKVVSYGKKYFHVINIDDPTIIDQEIADWLIEAYHLAGGTSMPDRAASDGTDSGSSSGMVPDDVEDPLA